VTVDAVTIEDDGPVLQATVLLSGCTAERALSAFTDPAELAKWWGGATLRTSLTAGGPYTVEFTALGQTMIGQVVSYVPASALEFTWRWAHEPEAPPRTVAVRASSGDQTSLTIRHGPHGDGASERSARADHRAGWEYFLPKLVSSLSG